MVPEEEDSPADHHEIDDLKQQYKDENIKPDNDDLKEKDDDYKKSETYHLHKDVNDKNKEDSKIRIKVESESKKKKIKPNIKRLETYQKFTTKPTTRKTTTTTTTRTTTITTTTTKTTTTSTRTSTTTPATSPTITTNYDKQVQHSDLFADFLSYQDFDVDKFLEKAKKEKRKKLKVHKPRIKRPLKRPVSRKDKAVSVTPAASKFPHFQPTNKNRRRNYDRVKLVKLAEQKPESSHKTENQSEDETSTFSESNAHQSEGKKVKNEIKAIPSSPLIVNQSQHYDYQTNRSQPLEEPLSIEMEASEESKEEDDIAVKRELTKTSSLVEMKVEPPAARPSEVLLPTELQHQQLPVENSSSSNGQGHHDNQVGQEGKSAENQVGAFSKTSFDNLKQN